MSIGKVVLIGVVGLGLAAVVVATASAASSSSLPRPPGIPAGASRQARKKGEGGVPFAREFWIYRNQTTGGGQPGTFVFARSLEQPDTIVAVLFKPDGGQTTPMQMGSDQANSGLLAQEAATLVA